MQDELVRAQLSKYLEAGLQQYLIIILVKTRRFHTWVYAAWDSNPNSRASEIQR